MNENNNNLNETNNNNQTNNDQNLFETREINQIGKNATQDVDTSFVEPKKHHFFGKFIILFLILVIGGACLYYFVLNTPKKYYVSLTEKLTKSSIISNSTNNNNISYSIKTNITSEDEETMEILKIVNKFNIAGTIKYDNKQIKGNNNIKYNDGELFDITYLLDLDKKSAYLKINKALNKIIKFELPEEQKELTDNIDVNKDDYLDLINLYIKNFKLTLENAKYEREITKLNNSYVFKETLLLDSDFSKDLLTKLLHDDEFLQKSAKIKNTTVSSVSEDLNNQLSNIEDQETSTISIYRNILNNEMKKAELKDEDNSVTIIKEDSKYTFEIVEANQLETKGYINIVNNSNETNITFNLEEIKDKISINLDLTYSTNGVIDELNTKDAVDYTELTEEDFNSILKYVKENKALNALLKDLGLSEYLDVLTNM